MPPKKGGFSSSKLSVTPLHYLLPALLALAPTANAATMSELQARVQQLEEQLAQARAELEEAGKSGSEAATDTVSANSDSGGSDKIQFDVGGGTLRVGGAVRVNYAVGDYPESGTGAASRAWGDGGNFSLDTYRINLDYSNGGLLGKAEYRWYNGYSFLHTAWMGYRYSDGSEVQVGVNRVPFGPGPYGISQSWFFDQHYYVGLADDMDLGIKYHMPSGPWKFDVAYYIGSEGHYKGGSRDSARYSYDVVNESGNGYRERNQVNLRAIYSIPGDSVSTDVGFSLQYGQLDSTGPQPDGSHSAGSVHMVNTWGKTTLATQLSYYQYNVDAAQPLGTDKLVQFGAYDFPNTVAARAWVPAVSLSYHKDTPGIGWLDYVVPYVEYSALVKPESGFNDSKFVTVGAAWASGPWYIYSDFAFSNGNEFIGGNAPYGDRLGANAANDWQTRVNLNLGYYF